MRQAVISNERFSYNDRAFWNGEVRDDFGARIDDRLNWYKDIYNKIQKSYDNGYGFCVIGKNIPGNYSKLTREEAVELLDSGLKKAMEYINYDIKQISAMNSECETYAKSLQELVTQRLAKEKEDSNHHNTDLDRLNEFIKSVFSARSSNAKCFTVILPDGNGEKKSDVDRIKEIENNIGVQGLTLGEVNSIEKMVFYKKHALAREENLSKLPSDINKYVRDVVEEYKKYHDDTSQQIDN